MKILNSNGINPAHLLLSVNDIINSIFQIKINTMAQYCKYLFATALLVSLLPGCNNEKDLNTPESGVFTEYMDTTIRPGDNFYEYANGNWIKNTEIPPNRSNYWTGTVLYENSQKNFQKIIEQAQTANKEDDPLQFLIEALYTSYLDTTSRESAGIGLLKVEFEKIDAIDNVESLSAWFAYSSRLGVRAPVSYEVNADLGNPEVNTLYLNQSGLGFQGPYGAPDRDYYLRDDARSREILQEYSHHISEMFRLAGIDCDRACVSGIVEMETAIASLHLSKEETRDFQEMYHPYSVDSLHLIAPNLSWKILFQELDAPGVKRVIVLQPEFLQGIDRLTVSESLSKWKNYLKWQLLHQYAKYLTTDIEEENFRFYGNILYGIPEQSSLQERAAETVNQFLGDAVGQLYVKDHFPSEIKVQVESIVEKMRNAFAKRIERADWMSDDTRQKAIIKLEKMQFQIGYPEKWKDYTGVELQKDDLFGNIKALNTDRHNEWMSLVGKTKGTTSHLWAFFPPHVPNGYYNQNGNEVFFTAGILQPPLFNFDVDEAVVYGQVGGLIGHEMTHGFDDEGGNFDENGALSNWWSASSKDAFNKRSRMLVDQYNAYTVLDSLHINGEYTLGENMANLGALHIALETYRLSLDGKESPDMDGFNGLQRVFLGYAQMWRGKYRDDALRRIVQTDHHAPREFNVNGVVRNIPEFYTLFDVLPTDSLYLPPEERVEIW
jgi:putative endopeptidase